MRNNLINMNAKYKMQTIEVKSRNEKNGFIKLQQLYCVINESFDIHVNGSLEVVGNRLGKLKKAKVYANLCNQDGAILYVINSWSNYPISAGIYKSFSLYCSSVNRFFEPSELAYVEIYLSFNESD